MVPNESMNNQPEPHVPTAHAPSPMHAPAPADHSPVHAAPSPAQPPMHVPPLPPVESAPVHASAPAATHNPAAHLPTAASPLQPKHASPLFTLGTASLILVILGWLTVALLGTTRSSESNELDGKLDELTTELRKPAFVTATAQYTAIDAVLTKFEDLRAERLLFYPTWETIKKNVPKDVQFASFALDDDGTFRIAGVSRSISSVSQFAVALTDAKYKTVTPLAVDKQSDKDLYNFSISFKRGAAQ